MGRPRKLSPCQERRIGELYLDGLQASVLGKTYGINKGTVYTVLDRLGISRHHCTVDGAAFDEPLTSEAKYFLGFLMADGSVRHQKGCHVVSLEISEDDIEILLRFQDFLQSTYAIGHRRNMVSTQVISKEIVDKISRYGVVPNKTYTAEVHDLEYDRDFWRGCIDGDGTVGIYYSGGYAYPELTLYGAPRLCSQFKDFILSIYPQYGGSVGRNRECAKVRAVGNCAAALMSHLYDNCQIALSRKRSIVDRILSSRRDA